MNKTAQEYVDDRLHKLARYEKHEEEWKPFLAEPQKKKENIPGGAFTTTGLGALGGGALGGSLGSTAFNKNKGALISGVLLGALLGGATGYGLGQQPLSISDRFKQKMSNTKTEEEQEQLNSEIQKYLKENEGTEAAEKLKALGWDLGFE